MIDFSENIKVGSALGELAEEYFQPLIDAKRAGPETLGIYLAELAILGPDPFTAAVRSEITPVSAVAERLSQLQDLIPEVSAKTLELFKLIEDRLAYILEVDADHQIDASDIAYLIGSFAENIGGRLPGEIREIIVKEIPTVLAHTFQPNYSAAVEAWMNQYYILGGLQSRSTESP